MKFETLKFMLNKIIHIANNICSRYENKPENEIDNEWCVFEELTDILSCAFDFIPIFTLNEDLRLIIVYYDDDNYKRVDKVALNNFEKYMLKLYDGFNKWCSERNFICHK